MPVKSASSRVRSETDPATSAATIGGSARTTGICETPYSCRICDRLGDGLARVGVHQVGQPAVLAAQHLADGLDGRSVVADREAVLRQPLVVEDLGEVAAAGVRQQHHDHGVLALGRAGELVRPAGFAAYAAMPDEPPTSSASSRASRRVNANESASETSMIRSATSRS